MLRNLENKGNPWGLAEQAAARSGPRASASRSAGPSPGTKLDADVEYLFWVGCAGALEDRSKKVTRAFAELLQRRRRRVRGAGRGRDLHR